MTRDEAIKTAERMMVLLAELSELKTTFTTTEIMNPDKLFQRWLGRAAGACDIAEHSVFKIAHYLHVAFNFEMPKLRLSIPAEEQR